MATNLHVHYVQYLTNLSREVLDIFSVSLSSKLSLTTDEVQSPSAKSAINHHHPHPLNFSSILRSVMGIAEKEFKTKSDSALLQGSDWNYDNIFHQLQEEMTKIGAEKRTEEVAKMIKAIEVNVEASLTESVQTSLNDASASMWGTVIESFKSASESSSEILSKKAHGIIFI